MLRAGTSIRWGAALALAGAGCHGDVVDATTDASTTDVAASCDVVPNNLVPNASFEEGADATVTGWPADLEGVTGGADQCARWARFVATGPDEGFTLHLPISAPAGAQFEFGISLERLDDDLDQLLVYLQSDDVVDAGRVFKTLADKTSWARVSGTLTLTKPVTLLNFGVASNSSKARRWGVDRAWVVRTR